MTQLQSLQHLQIPTCICYNFMIVYYEIERSKTQSLLKNGPEQIE